LTASTATNSDGGDRCYEDSGAQYEVFAATRSRRDVTNQKESMMAKSSLVPTEFPLPFAPADTGSYIAQHNPATASQIRSSKHEIRNKSKWRRTEIQNDLLAWKMESSS
jgi:hypothetical protein